MLNTSDRAVVDFTSNTLVYEPNGSWGERGEPQLTVKFRSPATNRVHEVTLSIHSLYGRGVFSEDIGFLQEALQFASTAVSLIAMNQSEKHN